MNNWMKFIVIVFVIIGCTNADKSGKNQEKRLDPLDWIKKIESLNNQGYNITDMHAHLKGGLTMEELLVHSELTGIRYGVAVNCGVGFPIENDEQLKAYFKKMKDYPVLHAMQAEGREWLDTFSKESIDKFDYVFTDALTFFDEQGRRNRLWIKDEVFMADKQKYMDYYVNQIVKIINDEPFDIFVNPTFLPEVLVDEYDELWTDERINKMISALAANNVALEINARYEIPSPSIIKKAKVAGVKFTLGTNNGGRELGYLAYGLRMIEACKLKPEDFWYPENSEVKEST
ncbi:MAG TPA: hypothetical protein ACFCUD_09350 [Cyclobacteriaceae bacterium]